MRSHPKNDIYSCQMPDYDILIGISDFMMSPIIHLVATVTMTGEAATTSLDD